jgi:hypothetical protein
MRGFRSTLILLAVFAGLLAYIYFVESKKTPGGEPPKEKVFAGVTADKVGELSVKTSGQPATVLKKADGAWQVVEPAPSGADDAAVTEIANSLATVEIQRVVEEKAGDLKPYGLAEPRIEVGFKTAGGKDGGRLLVGDKTATGGDLYAKLPGQPRVFLISAYNDATFNRSAFDLRDKAVLKFDRNKVDALEAVTAERTVQMAKTGEEWKLTKPVDARADYGTVEGLVGRLQTAQMKAMIASDAPDLKEYGLDKPEATATLTAGSARAVLLLGKKSADGTLFAKDASRPMIFTVEAGLLDELKKPADDYRRKDVFEARPYNAGRLEITRGKDALVFEKVKGTGKDTTEKWRQTSPAAREVDAARMDEFLTKLTNLRVQSWAAPTSKTGTDSPVLTVVLSFDDGKKQERVVLGQSGGDTYAARASEPGAAKLDAAEYDAVIKALDALK